MPSSLPDRVVPVVNRSATPDRNRTHDRNRNDDRNRVQPIRVGGKTGGMDVPRNDNNNGTWNPRPERTGPDAGRYAPRGNTGNSGKVSKATPKGTSPSRGYEATSSTITQAVMPSMPRPSTKRCPQGMADCNASSLQ